MRLKKEADSKGGATCDVYECYSLTDDSVKNQLARVELGTISIMAPTEGQKFQAVEDSSLVAAWKDLNGAFIEVKEE